jgi:glycosyltransferase involved in cell wall biosynthesis
VKVAYVVPRYGTEVIGGAEYATRMFAERLAARPGWQVEVVTTTAVDSNTWAPHYPEADVDVRGVLVRRLRAESGRSAAFPAAAARALQVPGRASVADQERFVDAQGPVAGRVVEAVAASDADLAVFYPYLFWTTVRGLPAVADRSVLHPAAHDEAAIRLPIYQPVFGAARGLVFQTESERALVHGLFPIGATPQLLLGLGVEEAEGEPAAARDGLGLGERPYLVYVGRVDRAKGCEVLARWFAAYKRRRPGPLVLVLAGQVVEPPPDHPDVLVTGPVDDATKWGLLRGATAVVSPGAFEAFSLLVIEGWTAGAPVLVNGRCRPTREHAERSGAGLWYESYAGFESILDRLLADPAAGAALAARGRAYVDANFSWPVLIDRYANFLETVAARR